MLARNMENAPRAWSFADGGNSPYQALVRCQVEGERLGRES
jgi:hypothetical protein